MTGAKQSVAGSMTMTSPQFAASTDRSSDSQHVPLRLRVPSSSGTRPSEATRPPRKRPTGRNSPERDRLLEHALTQVLGDDIVIHESV
jgi:hypothetical protein